MHWLWNINHAKISIEISIRIITQKQSLISDLLPMHTFLHILNGSAIRNFKYQHANMHIKIKELICDHVVNYISRWNNLITSIPLQNPLILHFYPTKRHYAEDHNMRSSSTFHCVSSSRTLPLSILNITSRPKK